MTLGEHRGGMWLDSAPGSQQESASRPEPSQLVDVTFAFPDSNA